MGDPQDKKAAPPALVAALRTEFLRLVDDDAFIQNLTLIERLAGRAREVILTLVIPDGMVPRRRGSNGPFYNAGLQANVYAGGQEEYGPDLATGSYGVASTPVMMPGGANHEQFGAKAIREVVNLFPTLAEAVAKAAHQSPVQQVLAITTARDRGLTELADKLEAKLLGGGDEDDDPKPVAVDVEPHVQPQANGASS
jgi:hypothetical protein